MKEHKNSYDRSHAGRVVAGLLLSVLFAGSAQSFQSNNFGRFTERADLEFFEPAPTVLLSHNFGQTAAGNAYSVFPALSADNRYAVFVSGASDLVPNDLNGGYRDIFRQDLTTGTIELVSMNAAGTGSGNYISTYPLISANGRYIAFTSIATDLTADSPRGGVFIRDMQTGITKSVSVNLQGQAEVGEPSAISPDGRYVVFTATSQFLTSDPSPGATINVFVRDTWTDQTRLVSMSRTGATGDRQSGRLYGVSIAAISADGRFIVFPSFADDLVTATGLGNWESLFVRDMVTGQTRLITIDYAANQASSGQIASFVMSADGRYVAYASVADRIAPNDTNSKTDIFVYDMANAANSLISMNSAGTASANGLSIQPAISADGRFVAYSSTASNISPQDRQNDLEDVYLCDRQTGITMLVSVDHWNLGSGNNDSSGPAVSDDGRFVVFSSYATNLSGTLDKNRDSDVFLRDVQHGVTKIISANGRAGVAGNASSQNPRIATDGSFVLFDSTASDLVGNDHNGVVDLFLVQNNAAKRTDKTSNDMLK